MKEVLTDLQHLEALYDEIGGRIDIYNTFRALLAGLMLGAAGGFINVFAVPAAAAMLKSFQGGELQRAEEIQRRLNRCFPRGGEGIGPSGHDQGHRNRRDWHRRFPKAALYGTGGRRRFD